VEFHPRQPDRAIQEGLKCLLFSNYVLADDPYDLDQRWKSSYAAPIGLRYNFEYDQRRL
jgi:hypothetical protein